MHFTQVSPGKSWLPELLISKVMITFDFEVPSVQITFSIPIMAGTMKMWSSKTRHIL